MIKLAFFMILQSKNSLIATQAQAFASFAEVIEICITVLEPNGEKVEYRKNSKGLFPHLFVTVSEGNFSIIYPLGIKEYFNDPIQNENIFQYPFIIEDLIENHNLNAQNNQLLSAYLGDPDKISLKLKEKGASSLIKGSLDFSICNLINNMANKIIQIERFDHSILDSLKTTISVYPELENFKGVNAMLEYEYNSLFKARSATVVTRPTKIIIHELRCCLCPNLVDSSLDGIKCSPPCLICNNCRVKDLKSCVKCKRFYSNYENDLLTIISMSLQAG